MAEGALLLQELLAAFHDPLHGGVPVSRDQFAALADQWLGEPVLVGDTLPTCEKPFWSKASPVDAVFRAAANAHHDFVLNGDVAAAAIAAQHAGGLDPVVDVALREAFQECVVHAGRPLSFTRERGPRAPYIGNTIHHDPTSLSRLGLWLQDYQLAYHQSRVPACGGKESALQDSVIHPQSPHRTRGS